jgi:hypothetical protein
MLVQHWGIGHAPYLWALRQNPKIAHCFAALWGVSVDDLLVSFDGAAMALPHESTHRGYYRGNKWFHFDQRLSDNKFQCVQSWVTGLDVLPGDATLTVLEGSHTLRDEFARVFNLTDQKDDWYKMSDAQIEWMTERGCVVRDITCPAGSMVFWDSRTAHAGKEAVRDRAVPNTRCVGYMCFTPRELATEAALKKKRAAFQDGRTTSHWPHRPKFFPKHPRTYGGPLPDVIAVPLPELSPLGMRLAGF